jgi:alcohol dehydrogenase class IV
MNALAHAVEGLYARDASPLTLLMAESALASLGASLPVIQRDGTNLAARYDALYGAWLAGSVLGRSSMGLHHKLCHVLGGSFDLPHAEVHAVMLPYVVAFNAPVAVAAMHILAKALAISDPVSGLFALSRAINAPTSLRELGMAEEAIGEAATIGMEGAYANPRAVTREALLALLRAAWAGTGPG